MEEKELEWIWVSTRQWTAAFDLNVKGIITKPAPIGWKFRGWHYKNMLKKFQSGGNLLDWKIYFRGWQNDIQTEYL